MRPIFFGPGDDLFGCFHPGAAHGDLAVVLCSALLGEHVQQYRLLNRLATSLATSDLPVLRFDWYGTGDSASDLDTASVARWLEDLATACDWVRRQTRRERVVLAGWRLGATLASVHAARDDGVAGLAMWDPVVDGGGYLRELHAVHKANLGRYLPAGPEEELLGFWVPSALQADIRSVHLTPSPGRPVLVTGVDQENLRSAQRILGPGGHVRVEPASMPEGWLAPEDGIYDVLVPVAPLRSTVSWIRGLVA